MTKLDALCACGHRQAAHAGKGHLEDCSESYTGPRGWEFCKCKKFRETQFKSEEEIEMAKSSSKKSSKKSNGEGRSVMLYSVNLDRARELRDGQYKGKENFIASSVRAIANQRKDALTFDEMVALVGEEIGDKKNDILPRKALKKLKVIKSSKERTAAASDKPKREKKARKPRSKSKANGSATTEERSERKENGRPEAEF